MKPQSNPHITYNSWLYKVREQPVFPQQKNSESKKCTSLLNIQQTTYNSSMLCTVVLWWLRPCQASHLSPGRAEAFAKKVSFFAIQNSQHSCLHSSGTLSRTLSGTNFLLPPIICLSKLAPRCVAP